MENYCDFCCISKLASKVMMSKWLETIDHMYSSKEIQPVHSEGDQPWDFFGRNAAKAETPVLWPPHEKSWLIGKDSDEIGGRRRRGRQRMRWLDGITDWMDVSRVNSGSWWWTGRPGVLWFMGSQRVGHDWVTELNWTDAICGILVPQLVLSSVEVWSLNHWTTREVP